MVKLNIKIYEAPSEEVLKNTRALALRVLKSQISGIKVVPRLIVLY